MNDQTREPQISEEVLIEENAIVIDLRASGLNRTQISQGWVQTHPGTRLRIQKWLAAKGVSVEKICDASDHVLANAFKAGYPYVRKMMQNSDSFGNFSNIKPTRFNDPTKARGALDLDDDIKDVLRNDPFEPIKPSDIARGPIPQISDPSKVLADRGIDPETLARSAAQVIGPRIEAAKTELRREIQSEATRVQTQLGNAVEARWTEALVTFEKKTQGIVDGMRDEIFRYIDERTPRKIDITKNGNIIRQLPEEARHKAFDIGLQWLNIGQHLYIVGPAGTGKTHLFKQWGQALDKKVWLVGQALSKYDISGFKGPTGEYFGTIVRDALEQGGLLCIDEGDMWAAAALGFLNAPLANGWCAFPDKTIEVHPDFQCIIAANTFGRGATQEYIGRNPLDAASIDRFAYIIVDYDEDLERNLHGNGPWTQYVQRIRKAVQELKLQHIVSMRATERLNKAISAGMDPEQALFSSIWRGLSVDTVAKVKSLAGEPPRMMTIEDNTNADDYYSDSFAKYDGELENLPETFGGLRDHFNRRINLQDRFYDLATFIAAATDYKNAKTKTMVST